MVKIVPRLFRFRFRFAFRFRIYVYFILIFTGRLKMYSEKVMDHFSNPRNVGEIEDADGVGEVGNPTCGDMMNIYIKVKDGILTDVKFKTFGCGAAIATSSMVTEIAVGKTIEEALEITRNDVAEELGGLPQVKMHCSNLAADGLHAAIEDYQKKQNIKK